MLCLAKIYFRLFARGKRGVPSFVVSVYMTVIILPKYCVSKSFSIFSNNLRRASSVSAGRASNVLPSSVFRIQIIPPLSRPLPSLYPTISNSLSKTGFNFSARFVRRSFVVPISYIPSGKRKIAPSYPSPKYFL